MNTIRNDQHHAMDGKRIIRALRGFSLVELMVALSLGLMLSISVVGVYMAQVNTYKTNVSQAGSQNIISAITALMSPTLHSAGFCGCASVTLALSNLRAGGPPPLGTISTTPSMLMGYDAAAGTTINITQNNAPNTGNTAGWNPNLHTSLRGDIQATSDVLIVLSPLPGTSPIAVTAFTPGSSSITLQNTTSVTAGQFAAISDCSKASIFQITGVAGTVVTHAEGAGTLSNASDALSVNYPIGSQFVILTQTAFFVGRDASGESALIRATLNAGGTWTLQSLVPDVETMQVLYGIGTNGSLSRYVPANSVTNWNQVYAIRLGFITKGQTGSGANTPTVHNVLGTTVNVPSDNRLRHVFEMTIHLRNTNS